MCCKGGSGAIERQCGEEVTRWIQIYQDMDGPPYQIVAGGLFDQPARIVAGLRCYHAALSEERARKRRG